MSVWITQWLCPQRHCSIALAWEHDEGDARPPADEDCAAIEQVGEDIYASGSVRRHCGLCGGDLQVEHAPSRFKSLQEAMPHLAARQAANLQTAAMLQGRRN